MVTPRVSYIAGGMLFPPGRDQMPIGSASLFARAQRLWPDNEALQIKWMRAVGVVRRTKRGWLLDNPRGREQ